MSIEGIEFYHFSATTHPETASVPEPRTRHAMFHSFLYDDKKIDSTTTAAHKKYNRILKSNAKLCLQS